MSVPEDRPKGGRIARAAAMLCQDEKFWRFLDSRRRVVAGTHNQEKARAWLVQACGVKSRAELDHNAEAAQMLRKIIVSFQRDLQGQAAAPQGAGARRQELRLPALLDAARDAPCMRCGRDDGTTVAAHYQGPRSHAYGKGVSQKPDDHCVAFLCLSCHALLDSYGNAEQALQRSEEFLHLVVLTMGWLFRKGHLVARRSAA